MRDQGKGSILTSAPVARHYSAGINAARALLALWVMFAHLIPWSVVTQGESTIPKPLLWLQYLAARLFQPNGELNPAVLAFVVMSGYCIHRAGFRQQGDVTNYFARRSFRILPIYFAASICGILAFLVAFQINSKFASQLSGTSEVSASCFAAKLSGLAALVPYFHPCSFVGNAPLTSAMVEIWLYIIYAGVFVLLIWRGFERAIWILCVVLFAASLVVASRSSDFPIFYNWWQNSSVLSFMPFWWIGTLFLYPAVAIRARILAIWSSAIWLALTVLPVNPVNGEIRKLAFAVLFGAILVGLETLRFPAIRYLGTFGNLSYSLFAFHAPLTYVLLIAGVPWWLVVAINLIAAWIAYVVIERTGIQFGKSYLQRSQVDRIPSDADLALKSIN